MKVYFLPGMCVNCKVFDKITLPAGYEKVYIEWLLPNDEPFEKYVHQMAATIDGSKPFILLGYSMGGIIMQEINHFLKPEKNILISSVKHEDEIPTMFRFAQKTHLNNMPKQIYNINQHIPYWFARIMLSMSFEEIEQYITYTSADYMKWAIRQITEWIPKNNCDNLFHIHGTEDEIFPFKQIKNVFEIKGGNHMMILRQSEDVSRIIAQILQ